MVAMLQPLVVVPYLKRRRRAPKKRIVDMMREVQLTGVKIGLLSLCAMRFAIRGVVNAPQTEGTQPIDKQGVVSTGVSPIPRGIAIKVTDEQRGSALKKLAVSGDNFMSNPDIAEIARMDVCP